jgi:tetratricopeptide (TPR) repeat protein
MKDRLLADLDARFARHANGDSSGVLDDQALTVVTELVALGEPDAGSLARVAALHLFRAEALAPELGETDRRLALALYTNLHAVDPRLVPPDVRTVLGLASPHDTAVALLREYERNAQDEHLERAISLFRQELLENPPDHADCLQNLATALLCRFERFGEPADYDEAIELRFQARAIRG